MMGYARYPGSGTSAWSPASSQHWNRADSTPWLPAPIITWAVVAPKRAATASRNSGSPVKGP